MKRLLVLLVLVVLAVPGTAHAESIAQVAAALRSSPVYQSPGLDVVDVAGLTSVLSGTDPQVDVAVLPAAAASSDQQARLRAIAIGKALADSNLVVLVITANQHFGVGEGNAAASRGVNASAALAQERAAIKGQPFNKATLTAFVTGFVQQIGQQVSSVGSSTGGTTIPAQPTSSSNTGAYLLGGLVVIGGGATALAVRSSRNRKKRLNEGLRADVEQLYNRLGNDVGTLDARDNAVARQAMADASERYNSAGATLATADSPPEFAAARRTAIEGLTAAQTARKALGLDPGPEVPSLQGSGPHLTGDQQVQFGDQAYDGSPAYQPGRGHYFEGGNVNGQMVPGGWYSAPFWTPFLLGSLLSGGFGGGGLFGGGYGGGGYERGYEEGRENATDNSGGGDWGGGGNGGGGDWGGGGGGGDWGGGGGDSGGGGGGDW
jgi:hypothetical protein